MNRSEDNWKETLRTAPLSRRHFEEAHKRYVRSRIGRKARKPYYRWLAAMVCLASVLIGLAWLFDTEAAERDVTRATEPSQEYYRDSELLLRVFPDPELRAGKEYGYIFHFANLTKSVIGKELAIDAVHLDTGRRVVAALPSVIDEKRYAGESWERYIVQCALPLGGLWRYEVMLNDAAYASVVLDVGEPDWELATSFASGRYELTGIDGVIGFIDAGFVAAKPNKYMWHVWGEPDALDGDFEVLAVKQGSKQLIPVVQGMRFGGPLNGADGARPTMMTLPEPGKWRLLPFIGGRMLDSIVVEVAAHGPGTDE